MYGAKLLLGLDTDVFGLEQTLVGRLRRLMAFAVLGVDARFLQQLERRAEVVLVVRSEVGVERVHLRHQLAPFQPIIAK